MKTLFTFFTFLFIGFKLLANPIAIPTAIISELYFDESNNWKLEVWVNDEEISALSVDSILLSSSTDSIALTIPDLTETNGIWVITADSIADNFTIDRYSDIIKLWAYFDDYRFLDELIFGDNMNASINYPRIGQSISKYEDYYVKDNTPTIGSLNDTIDMCGTIMGLIYDINLNPVKNHEFIIDFPFETSVQGSYSARVLAKPNSIDYIKYFYDQYPYIFIEVNEITYTMEPDSVIEYDIYLQDTLLSVTNTLEAKAPVAIYPNPISASSNLNINIDLPIMSSNIWVEIIDIQGKLVKKKKIISTTSEIKVPKNKGFYLVNIQLDSKIITSKKLLVNE